MLDSLVSGGLGFLGVKDTNQANQQIASARNAMEIMEAEKARTFSQSQAGLNRKFQSGQVKKQMDFQERMSSTAVQRRMQDMKRAGINPILAAKYDASSPAGAAGSGGIGATAKANAHGYTAQNKMQGLLNNLTNALMIKKVNAEIDNIDANTSLTHRKTNLTDPLNRMMDILDKIVEGGAGNLNDYKEKAQELRKEVDELRSYLSGEKGREADEIRNSPGVELTPGAKEDKFKADWHKKFRESNKGKSPNEYTDFGDLWNWLKKQFK